MSDVGNYKQEFQLNDNLGKLPSHKAIKENFSLEKKRAYCVCTCSTTFNIFDNKCFSTDFQIMCSPPVCPYISVVAFAH